MVVISFSVSANLMREEEKRNRAKKRKRKRKKNPELGWFGEGPCTLHDTIAYHLYIVIYLQTLLVQSSPRVILHIKLSAFDRTPASIDDYRRSRSCMPDDRYQVDRPDNPLLHPPNIHPTPLQGP
jgi:hypothetical protein